MFAKISHISKALLLTTLLSSTCAAIPSTALSVTPRSNDEQTANRVYTKANPSVVTIRASGALGSGFVINRNGTILTNAHVVQGAPSVVTVVFANGQEYPADVLGFARGGQDLAILKINSGKPMPALILATPGSVQVGDRVYAIGTPLKESNSNTFTQGVVSRLDPQNGIIQHSAPINAGNSGGPLLNSLGQVIGINTAIELSPVFDGQGRQVGVAKGNNGIGFSIAVDRLRSFVAAAQRRELSSVSTLAEANTENAEKRQIRPITLDGQMIVGVLEPGDQTLEDGSWADGYAFSGEAGQTVVIEMSSQEFNPLLLLYKMTKNEKGETTPEKIATNDDAGPGTTNARITIKLPTSGDYFIVANSSAPGEQGKYQIRAVAR